MNDKQGRDRDQEYEELLQELRVTIPAVEVLFAFLLILPFSQGFAQVTQVERGVYLATFLCAAISSVLLIAPSAFHRLRWRQHDKEAVLRASNRFAVTGMVFLAVAISSGVYLVISYVQTTTWAAGSTAIVALLTAVAWYVLPLARRARQD